MLILYVLVMHSLLHIKLVSRVKYIRFFSIIKSVFLPLFLGTTIIFDMSLTYICMALLAVIINNFLVNLLSLHTRVTFGYVVSFLTLLFVGLCDIWFAVFSKQVSYRVTLAAVAVVALGCTGITLHFSYL